MDNTSHEVSFDDLPVELNLAIFSLAINKDNFSSLYRVSKLFHDLFINWLAGNETQNFEHILAYFLYKVSDQMEGFFITETHLNNVVHYKAGGITQGIMDTNFTCGLPIIIRSMASEFEYLNKYYTVKEKHTRGTVFPVTAPEKIHFISKVDPKKKEVNQLLCKLDSCEGIFLTWGASVEHEAVRGQPVFKDFCSFLYNLPQNKDDEKYICVTFTIEDWWMDLMNVANAFPDIFRSLFIDYDKPKNIYLR